MTTKGFTVSHADDAQFVAGLRSFFEYRDLGIKEATEGRVAAHVIRALPGAPFNGVPHRHGVTFQLVYVLKGWIEFEYEGQGVVRLDAGLVRAPAARHPAPRGRAQRRRRDARDRHAGRLRDRRSAFGLKRDFRATSSATPGRRRRPRFPAA